MKKIKFISFVLLILLYSCNQKKQKSIDNSAEKNTEIITKDLEKTNSKEKKRYAKTLPELFSMNSFIGKYPTQIKLFENEILKNRLKNINRFDYDALITNWNTETPISIENQIIHASGCKAHNCPSNGYELFIDLKNDNINIYYFRDNTLKVYTEKEWIDLPKGFNNEIEVKKDNAKIGSLSDDMKSTYNITTTYSTHNSNKEIASKISDYLKNILKDDLKLMTKDQRKFQYEEVDLNDDGVKEYLVGFKNSYFCGSGGCTFYLLNNNGSVITIFTVADTPFIAMANSKSNGWKDLLVKSNGDLRHLKFNGKTYPSNPSVAPIFKETPNDDAHRLLWDKLPIPSFNF